MTTSRFDMLETDGKLCVLEVNPSISHWRELDRNGWFLNPDGIGAAMAQRVMRALEKAG